MILEKTTIQFVKYEWKNIRLGLEAHRLYQFLQKFKLEITWNDKHRIDNILCICEICNSYVNADTVLPRIKPDLYQIYTSAYHAHISPEDIFIQTELALNNFSTPRIDIAYSFKNHTFSLTIKFNGDNQLFYHLSTFLPPEGKVTYLEEKEILLSELSVSPFNPIEVGSELNNK